MSAKPVVPRDQALQDVEDPLRYCMADDAEASALGFIDALEHACAHIGRHPVAGSPRYAHELNLARLRSWPLKRYPYLVLYVERSDHVDVWRLLPGQRDIPAWMHHTEDIGASPQAKGSPPGEVPIWGRERPGCPMR